MRTESVALVLVALLGGCAARGTTTPGGGDVTGPATTVDARVSAGAALPADVRAFIEDRDLCDHFRSEPWPEGDSAQDRARRRELVEGVRTACAGTDRRLTDLRRRYAGDATVIRALAGGAAEGP